MISAPRLCMAMYVLPFMALAQQQESQSDPMPKRPEVFRLPTGRANASNIKPRLKKASVLTATDWGAWIDSTWGPGQGAAAQTEIFDTFCGAVTNQWAGFPNLGLNWDSLRTTLRTQIGTGLSRGRFYALMSRVWLALREYHTGINDKKIDEPLGAGYGPGVPILSIGNYWWDGIGAPVTSQSDSTLFVYRAAPGNPLGLEPGDVLLGYEGVPWKKLYRSLLDAGVPVQRTYATGGSTPEAMTHVFLNTAGWNWGMFDTIDVVKYASGDTLHFRTELLSGFNLGESVFASDQVPVPGVPMPYEPGSSRAVSWGIVQGTQIGYVYVWDWATSSTQQLFQQAIDNLLHQRKVEGLVIDFRMNYGGTAGFANDGLSQLFNFDPTSHLWLASRNNPSDALSFEIQRYPSWSFTPSPIGFDRPIAVLIGPGCWSSGDFNAYRLKKHPMSRLFGKPTNGAFVYANYAHATFSDSWEYSFPTSVVYSDLPGEGHLVHKGVLPDEEVWLTRDGVAKSEDDVVKRALEWINTLSYAHDVQLNRISYDTILVSARVRNPLAHALVIAAILRDGAGTIIDSLSLKDDGLQGDRVVGDSLWSHSYVPLTNGMIHVTLRADDLTTATSRILPNAAQILFARGALIALDAGDINLGAIGKTLSQRDTTFTIRNIGFAPDSITMLIDPVNVDPVDAVKVSPTSFFLAPGDSQMVVFSVLPRLLAKQFYQAQVIVQPKTGVGQGSLSKSFAFQIVTATGVADRIEVPATNALEQNYPNPFNPSTTIRYGLPFRSPVTLTVFNTLGQEVAILQNAEEEAGYHEITFDGSNLSSGVYFYRIQAGSFVQTRKLLILR